MARLRIQVPREILYALADRGLMRHRIEEALKARLLRERGSLAEVISIEVDHEQESSPEEPQSFARAERPLR